MKQKNLIMLGVAMACGLVAAIAVAQLSAVGPRGPETVKVWVAKKDIPLGTKLDEKEIDGWVALVDMPKNMVSEDAIKDKELLINKDVNRTLKAANIIQMTDLGVSHGITLPEGCKQLTVKSSQVDAVGGFARPGSKVDVMYLERTQSGRSRSVMILRDMLILAVNMVDRIPEGAQKAIPQVESVSLAVTDKQAVLLSLLEERGRLKLMLRGPNSAPDKPEELPDWIKELVEGELDKTPVASGKEAKDNFETMVIAKENVPMNTELNEETLKKYFTTIPVIKAPEGVVKKIEDIKQKFVVKDLEKNQNLLASATANDPVELEEPKPVAPVAPAPASEPKIKLPRHPQAIIANGQTKKVVYLEIAPGKWKLFDTEKEADEYVPEVPNKNDSKPNLENKPASGDAKPLAGS